MHTDTAIKSIQKKHNNCFDTRVDNHCLDLTDFNGNRNRYPYIVDINDTQKTGRAF
jgi:hypothetical protein